MKENEKRCEKQNLIKKKKKKKMKNELKEKK